MSQESREKEKELESEIRSFEQERENIRKIIGKIGGQPTTKGRLINLVFVILVVAVFAMSLVWGGRVRFFMIELGILLLSLKLVYFLESYIKLNHFQFWILFSLEWRLDKIDKRLREVDRKFTKEDTSSETEPVECARSNEQDDNA